MYRTQASFKLETFFRLMLPTTYIHIRSQTSQLIMPMSLHRNIPSRQIRHAHNLHYQARPPGEMLRPLALSSLRIILFPSKARLRPIFIDSLDEIKTEATVQVLGLLLVRAAGVCVFLLDLLVHGYVIGK